MPCKINRAMREMFSEEDIYTLPPRAVNTMLKMIEAYEGVLATCHNVTINTIYLDSWPIDNYTLRMELLTYKAAHVNLIIRGHELDIRIDYDYVDSINDICKELGSHDIMIKIPQTYSIRQRDLISAGFKMESGTRSVNNKPIKRQWFSKTALICDRSWVEFV